MRLNKLSGMLLAVVMVLAASFAQASDVFNLGGTRNQTTGVWSGVASLEMVPVGNVGNMADTVEHSGNIAGQGAVGYNYNIGKYEVTAGQYTEFLNAVGGVDTYSLYNTTMGRTDTGSGITRSGGGSVGNPYTYTVDANFVNRPVNYVSYWDSCRFANWLQNNQPTGSQGVGTTETGAYTLTTDGITTRLFATQIGSGQ